jgi:hypothetical protein
MPVRTLIDRLLDLLAPQPRPQPIPVRATGGRRR